MNAIVKTRVEPELKAQAESVLREMGMDLGSAIRVFLAQVVQRQALPFEVKVVQPNALTLQAISDSHNGNVQAFESIEAMVADAVR